MINEFDIKDFKDIDCTKARIALDNATEQTNWAYCEVEHFIDQVEALQRKYVKPVAALLRADNG